MPGLEQLHRIVVTQYQAGSAHRWKACLAASCIVGRYERGSTVALAHDLCISVSQVENLAHAGWGWRTFRKFGVTSATRNRLTPSHFAAMFDLWREFEFDPWDAGDLLYECEQFGVSVAGMRQYILDRCKVQADEWERRLKRIVPQVEKLVNDYGVPEGVREAAKQFIEAIHGEQIADTNHHHPGAAAGILE